jgi:hypothetical protein
MLTSSVRLYQSVLYNTRLANFEIATGTAKGALKSSKEQLLRETVAWLM